MPIRASVHSTNQQHSTMHSINTPWIVSFYTPILPSKKFGLLTTITYTAKHLRLKITGNCISGSQIITSGSNASMQLCSFSPSGFLYFTNESTSGRSTHFSCTGFSFNFGDNGAQRTKRKADVNSLLIHWF